MATATTTKKPAPKKPAPKPKTAPAAPVAAPVFYKAEYALLGDKDRRTCVRYTLVDGPAIVVGDAFIKKEVLGTEPYPQRIHLWVEIPAPAPATPAG